MPCNDLCSKIHCKGPEFCEEPSKSNAGTKSDKKISEDARPNEIRMADIAAKPSHQKGTPNDVKRSSSGMARR